MKNKRGAKGFVPKLYLKTRTGGSVDSIAVITKPDAQPPQTTAAVPSTPQEPALVAPVAPPPPPPPLPAAPAAVKHFSLLLVMLSYSACTKQPENSLSNSIMNGLMKLRKTSDGETGLVHYVSMSTQLFRVTQTPTPRRTRRHLRLQHRCLVSSRLVQSP